MSKTQVNRIGQACIVSLRRLAIEKLYAAGSDAELKDEIAGGSGSIKKYYYSRSSLVSIMEASSRSKDTTWQYFDAIKGTCTRIWKGDTSLTYFYK